MVSLKGHAFFLSYLAFTFFHPSNASQTDSGSGILRRHHHRRLNHARQENTSHHLDRRAPPHGYTYQGCIQDGAPRTLSAAGTASATMTVDACVEYCYQRSYIYAGVEYSQECFCGNTLYAGRAFTPDSDCNMNCAGDATQKCGGPNRLSLYWSGATPPPPPASPVAPPTVGDWEYYGCYSDNVNGRALTTGVGLSGPATIELCTAACKNRGLSLAGLEYGGECYCGNAIVNGGAQVQDGCTMPCNGNSAQLCGGPNRLTVYHYTGAPVTPPSNPDTVGDWANIGCYTDNVNGRALPFAVGTGGQNSVNTCTAACQAAGYTFAGMEYGAECWCNDNRGVINGGAPTALSECSMPCQGNPNQFCGAGNRLNVYQLNGTPTSQQPTPTSTSTGPTPTPVGDWKYVGCFVDGTNGRILPQGGDIPGNTVSVETCTYACEQKGYSVAGMEYSQECYCGNSLVNGPTQAPESECSFPCAGNPNEKCGAGGRLSVWTTNANGTVPQHPVPAPQTTGLPASWTYQGCWKDLDSGQLRILPYKITSRTNTATECLTKCQAFGYPAAGLEYGEECYCGDIEDIQTKSPGQAPAGECGTPCSGNPDYICGGGNRLTLYYSSAVIHNWHTPANQGRYEYYMPGLVVPLIATVGINNKVTFLEKFGTGFPNTTGAYELDPSLVPDASKAWREMHVTSDVFCAASLILPDKAGRQINIGGWSFESTFGIRLYSPDGSPGVNGTNDWEENYPALHLQRGRWYPTALIMANSSILVIGGQKGSNDVPEPTLELLPKPPGGDTTIYLDWLQRTDPNNLYPFLTVLQSGRIFIAYYNEARILNPVDFSTYKVLPMIPGAVNNAGAGRTYPLEGAFVQLPMYAPYTVPLTVLICGGSAFGEALDNCVSISPEAANPQWTLERMPSRRVMSCMTALPDGTFLIANGAQKGVAGFGLGEDPNFTALLYDPTQPVHSRISIMDSTDIARMYHSETSLMPDGSVLISGSDPQTAWPNGTARYPEEFRLERFLPPYLTDGRAKPTYTIANKDWAYSQQYQVVVTSGNIANIRFSLVAATSSTHGNTMGGRTLFPAFTCAGNVCTITAPPLSASPPGWHMLFVLDGPTPSNAQWVRIGGDPARLGEWPNAPGFHPPGV